MTDYEGLVKRIEHASFQAKVTGKPVVTATQIQRIDDGIAKLPMPYASADLSTLGPSGAGWHRWEYGSESALVRRVDSQDPDHPRPMDHNYKGEPYREDGQSWRDRFIAVLPLMFTHRIVWGFVLDALEGHEDGWCYHDAAEAIAYATAWSGAPKTEPDGWHRHPATKRRRKPAETFVLEPGYIELARTDEYVEYMLDTDIDP